MKTLFRRWILKSWLIRNAAHLEAIQRERAMLDMSERHCVRQANSLRLELLNLDIVARRHA